MDDSGHRENGRHKTDQYKTAQGQWIMHHQPSMKQIMAIVAERDAALRERDLAISEKKTAVAERDMAILQRDTAIAERNNAILERDNAIASLRYQESTMNNSTISPCPPGCQVPREMKHVHHMPQHPHHPSHLNEAPYGTREMHAVDTVPLASTAPETAKSHQAKRTKEAKATSPNKKVSKPLRKVKKEGEDLNRIVHVKSHEWKDDGGNKHLGVTKPNWKSQDLGLNEVAFDESTMPVPVCSCTGFVRPCYKWGSGGWQSSCCTTTMSMYPLPAMPNKRHARVCGRKMSGSVFNKLLSRLAAEGHDLSNPVDLKDHWAKHGTNRYITIK